MAAYRIWENKIEHMAEDQTAYKAMENYLKQAKRLAPFVLLYTEKNKRPGWEVYYKGPAMFKQPPFSFIAKRAA